MAVPDNVIFGPGTTYGQIRNMVNVNDRVIALRDRLQFFLIDKVEQPGLKELAAKEGILYPQPYPLIIMSCIALETLGQVAFSGKDGEGFRLAISKCNQKFARKLPKQFIKQLQELMNGKKDLKNIDTVADLIYTHFRNTMFHGYRTSAVFLQHDQVEIITIDNGTLILNPQLVWNSVKDLYLLVFNDLITKHNSTYRIQCESYLEQMLK